MLQHQPLYEALSPAPYRNYHQLRAEFFNFNITKNFGQIKKGKNE